jgi:hypothetical protein
VTSPTEWVGGQHGGDRHLPCKNKHHLLPGNTGDKCIVQTVGAVSVGPGVSALTLLVPRQSLRWPHGTQWQIRRPLRQRVLH